MSTTPSESRRFTDLDRIFLPETEENMRGLSDVGAAETSESTREGMQGVFLPGHEPDTRTNDEITAAMLAQTAAEHAERFPL